MRNQALVLALLAGCGNGNSGGNNEKKDAAVPTIDAAPACATPPAPLIACTPVNGTTVKLRQIGRVSGGAMLATSPPNDGRLFVVERQGRIRIYENEMLKTEAFLDVTELPNFVAGGEQGLLGLAFHPDYCNNRQFYVFYTTNNANVVAKYTASASDPNKADPTGEVILSIPDFASNHNGGMIEFGRDGYLYIGTGDGGGGGDPQKTAQNLNSLLGKMLRIDVNTTSGSKKYGIPADNPYANGGGAPEVFIAGLRNPWRWSFDRETGDLYIGDVGQGGNYGPNGANIPGIEEVNVLKAGEQAGKNLGWSVYEGSGCFGGGQNCNPAGMTAPQYTRSGSENWHSVIGGEVYRGDCFPDLKGSYFFTDYTAKPLMRATLAANGMLDATPVQVTVPNTPVSIHGDARGELFLTTEDSYVYQIEAGP